jgi:hypothetical protein
VTVSVQIPYRALVADGTQTIFTYDFGYVESLDLYIVVNGELMTEYSQYTIESDNIDEGGQVVFVTAPATGLIVQIIRFTTRSQNVDYVETQPFPADTHEWNLDKITYILQELIKGAWSGTDDNGNPTYLTFDLDVFLAEYFTRVTNSGGTDADLPMWTTAEYAGVYAAEVDLEANLPADEAVSTKPDGFIYIGI